MIVPSLTMREDTSNAPASVPSRRKTVTGGAELAGRWKVPTMSVVGGRRFLVLKRDLCRVNLLLSNVDLAHMLNSDG